MDEYLVYQDTVEDIADAIRDRAGTSDPIYPTAMPDAIRNIPHDKELPDYTASDAGKVLTVNSAGDAVEWDESQADSAVIVHVTGSGSNLTADKTYTEIKSLMDSDSYVLVEYNTSLYRLKNNTNVNSISWYKETHVSTMTSNSYVSSFSLVEITLSSNNVWSITTTDSDVIPSAPSSYDKYLKITANGLTWATPDSELPTIQSGDANKVLKVNAQETDVAWSNDENGLPTIQSGDAGKALVVNSSETGVEWSAITSSDEVVVTFTKTQRINEPVEYSIDVPYSTLQQAIESGKSVIVRYVDAHNNYPDGPLVYDYYYMTPSATPNAANAIVFQCLYDATTHNMQNGYQINCSILTLIYRSASPTIFEVEDKQGIMISAPIDDAGKFLMNNDNGDVEWAELPKPILVDLQPNATTLPTGITYSIINTAVANNPDAVIVREIVAGTATTSYPKIYRLAHRYPTELHFTSFQIDEDSGKLDTYEVEIKSTGAVEWYSKQL